MKRIKLLLLSAFVCFGISNALAQTKVSGLVTSSEDGQPIPGVTIIVKGLSGVGTSTNIEGKYTLSVPTSGKVLVFSYVGFKTQEVLLEGKTSINVVLVAETKRIDEVVVTALGITRSKQALGYAVSDVKGDELAKARSQNVVSSLSGRVSGVQITGASGQMGGGSRIQVRGVTSLTQNNQPLFVVDGIPLDNSDFSYGATGGGGYDYGNMGSDLNSDDIESISILKGASATALYGSRAANGVVMVTTKKAKAGAQNWGGAVNSSITWDKASIIPVYQKLYGGGSTFSDAQGGKNGFLTEEIEGKEYKVVQYSTDESWGPKYDPSVKVLNWNAFDKWDTKNYLVEKPWVYPKNDYKYFFRTGVTYTNNVQLTGATDKGSTRISYTNMNVAGIYPNSELKRNTINFNGSYNFSKYLEGWATATYVVNTATGRPETGYGDRNPVQKMWQWIHTSVDYKELSNWRNPDGTQRSWNRSSWDNPGPEYTDNPYWSRYMNYQNDRRDRLFGNTGLTLTFTPWLKLTGRLGVDFYTLKQEERTAIGSQSLSSYDLYVRSNYDVNGEAFFSINKRFLEDKIGLSSILGASVNDRKYDITGGTTVGGLVIPEVYNLTNSVSKATSRDTKNHKRINSLYGNITLDYNRFVYLDLTARNDWSSTLPSGSNSYFYPSVNLSLVLSELEVFKSFGFIDYAKLRGGYAQVGNDTDAYNLSNYFAAETPFGSDPRYSLPTQLANAKLKPEETKSWEVGFEAKLFKSRFGVDVSYFTKDTKNQIVPIQVSGATGWASLWINAGKMENSGWEFQVSGTPLKTKNFSWDVTVNLSTLDNKVVDIAEGLDYLNLGNAPFKVQVGAYKGMAYPVIYGTDFVYDKDGKKVLSATGRYLPSAVKPLANVNPDFTGGVTNSFNYKFNNGIQIDANILLDMQKGGHMYYTSYMWGMYSGILAESASINENGFNIRDAIKYKYSDGTEGTTWKDGAKSIGGGLVLDGVYGKYNALDGSITYLNADGTTSQVAVKNTKAIAGSRYSRDHYSGPDTQNIFKTDYLKLREVRFGVTIPKKWTGPVSGLRVSFFGRNLKTWFADQQHFDPEYLQMAGSNAQGVEGGYLPSVATYGVGVNFNF
ncbi:SusC/RagA family TonB-linked outer membrane protein [Acetobacteroides hydrogenigenes]|uniref:TonB-linked SusC/RagA family outer membrane protein n=1 Tax=Acetobacteroides hydrogenigenes TaxID=979970 RepID=A0A4R2EFD8_9BACT|nr:SusC/RagA family TonB-linked outer membrane protein [Acetobacteroides hydrogenigenes]TCN66697.1 TonB-linked SusC/RagA family outer membrane protein [Acetobacteroides hydrogenigenes]